MARAKRSKLPEMPAALRANLKDLLVTLKASEEYFQNQADRNVASRKEQTAEIKAIAISIKPFGLTLDTL